MKEAIPSVRVVDAAIKAHIAPFLGDHGFRRRGRAFVRELDGGVSQRINLQAVGPRFGPGVNVYFGIGFDVLRKWDAAWLGVSEAEAAEIQFGESTGHMTAPHRFRTIELVPVADIAARLLREIREIVLPALDRYSSLESAIECWESDLPFGRTDARKYAPLARLALGDREGARKSALEFAARLKAVRAAADVIDEQHEMADFVMGAEAEESA